MSFVNVLLGDLKSRELLQKAEQFCNGTSLEQLVSEWYFERAFRLKHLPDSVDPKEAAETDSLIREYMPESKRAEIEQAFIGFVNRVFDVSDAILQKLKDHILDQAEEQATKITEKALTKARSEYTKDKPEGGKFIV